MATATATSSHGTANAGRWQRFIGAGILALVVGGVAWWSFANALPRPSSARDFRPDPGSGRSFGNYSISLPGANPAPRPRETVTVLPRIVTIRDGDMTISSSLRGDAKWNIYITFAGESLGGEEARRLALGIRRLVLDARTPPAGLKLTDDQRAKLQSVSLAPLELSDDQLRQLTDQLNESQKLSANAPGLAPIRQALAQLAAQVKGADRAAIKRKYAERDAKLREIFTPEQIGVLTGPRAANNSGNNPGGAAR